MSINVAAQKKIEALAAAKKYPKGFLPAANTGFNAVTWKFCPKPIFLLTFQNQDPDQGVGTVDLPEGDNDVTCDVPDGMSVTANVTTAGSETLTFRNSRAVDEQKFSVAVTASLKVEVVSAETSLSIATSSHVETDETRSTTVVSWYRTIYDFERDASARPVLTNQFTNALTTLPATFDSSDDGNKNKFFDFFREWGTHYLVRGSFGGNYLMNTTLAESVFSKQDTTDIESSIKASFDAGAASGSAKADIKSSTMKSLSTDDKNSSIVFYDSGGPGTGKELDEFLRSVSREPTLLKDATALATDSIRPIFDPIYLLVTDSVRQKTLLEAWRAYLPPEKREAGSVFGHLVAGTPATATTTKALSDGFAIACMAASNTDPDPFAVSLSHDLDITKAFASVEAAVWQSEGDDNWLSRASIIVPVKSGLYYSQGFRNPAAGATSAFIPTDLKLGELGMVQPESFKVAPSDGFLVVALHSGPDASDAVVVKVRPGGSGEAIFGCSVSRGGITRANATVPIPKGAAIEFEGSPDVVYWIPVVDPRWSFGAPKTLIPGTYVADSDGFASGVLEFAEPGNRGYLEIRTLDAKGQGEPVYSACSVHVYEPDGKVAPRNTAMLPISNGRTWTAVVTSTNGRVEGRVYWVPVMPTDS